MQIGVQILRTNFFTKITHMIRNAYNMIVLEKAEKADEVPLKALIYLLDREELGFTAEQRYQIRMAFEDGGMGLRSLLCIAGPAHTGSWCPVSEHIEDYLPEFLQWGIK